MSLFSALLVTLLHMKWVGNDSGVVKFLYQFIRNGMCKVAVPYFFIVSGFFIARHFDDNRWYRLSILKRIKTLLVPYIIWSILTMFIFYVTDVVIVNLLSGTGVIIPSFADVAAGLVQLIGLDLTRMPRVFPFWFIRALFLLVLISPLIKKSLECLGNIFLLALFLGSIAVVTIKDGPLRALLEFGFSIHAVFYFTVGIYISRFNISSQLSAVKMCLCSLGAFLFVLRLVLVYIIPELAGLLGAVSVPFVLYLLWYCMPKTRLPVWLTSCAFPIYMMHLIFIHLYGPLVKRVELGALHILFCFVFTFMSCFVVAALIRKIPKVAHVLYGNR